MLQVAHYIVCIPKKKPLIIIALAKGSTESIATAVPAPERSDKPAVKQQEVKETYVRST